MGILAGREPAQQDRKDADFPRVVSLREGVKRLIDESQREALSGMRQEVRKIVSEEMASQKAGISRQLTKHLEEFDERNILEEIREIKAKLQSGGDKVSDEQFRANLVKSVDDAVREKLMELEAMKDGMKPATKDVSDIIIRQFDALRQAQLQEMNSIRAQLVALKQRIDSTKAIEQRLGSLEELVRRKLSEPIIIE